jgi:hypothetical protein
MSHNDSLFTQLSKGESPELRWEGTQRKERWGRYRWHEVAGSKATNATEVTRQLPQALFLTSKGAGVKCEEGS